MHARNREAVDQWWRNVFDVGDALRSRVTVLHPHGVLGAYDGWYVAWQESAAHVSAPTIATADEVASYATQLAVRSGSSAA
jgi:sugar phosphate isomerase/epimerase